MCGCWTEQSESFTATLKGWSAGPRFIKRSKKFNPLRHNFIGPTDRCKRDLLACKINIFANSCAISAFYITLKITVLILCFLVTIAFNRHFGVALAL